MLLSLGIGACRRDVPRMSVDPVPWDSLACGDLVFLEGATLRADVVRMLEEGDLSCSHVGIVLEDSAYSRDSRLRWKVVHASPGEGDGVPSSLARVQCEPLDSFLDDPRIRSMQVWRWKQGDPAKACLAARWAGYQVGISFDREFRFETDSSLYCTELVWKAYNRVGLRLGDSLGQDMRLPFHHGSILFPGHLLTSGKLRRISPKTSLLQK